jgi:hypothetical protein
MLGWRDLGRFWDELRGRVPALAPAAPAVPSDAAARATTGRLLDARRRAAPRTSRPHATASEIAAALTPGSFPSGREEADASPITGGPVPLPGATDQLAGRSKEAAAPTPAEPSADDSLAGRVLKMRQQRRG